MTVVDPTGALITELRNLNIAQKRVRGFEPDEGDAQGPGKYKRYVVLVRLASPRIGRQYRLPLQRVRIAARCYGVTAQDAAALYGELSDAVDNAGPRLSGTGVAIYQSLDRTGGQADKDPETGQPYEFGVIELLAGTATVSV